jgi:predicted nucleic acid-binding protein
MYQSCRRAGKTPRSSNDCLIARIAVEHSLLLLHDDRDFETIAAVTPDLRLCPVK